MGCATSSEGLVVLPSEKTQPVTRRHWSTAAGQTTCEADVTQKASVAKELPKPKTKGRVLFNPQVKSKETSSSGSKANIAENAHSKAKTEGEKSEQLTAVVKPGVAKPVLADKVASEPPAKTQEPKKNVTEKVPSKPPAKTREAKADVKEKVASKPPAKTGEADSNLTVEFASEQPAKTREAKSTLEDKVASDPPAKIGEARADKEKVASKPSAKTEEAKSNLSVEVASEQAVKTRDANSTLEDKVVSDPPAKTDEAMADNKEKVASKPPAETKEGKSNITVAVVSEQPAKIGEAKTYVKENVASIPPDGTEVKPTLAEKNAWMPPNKIETKPDISKKFVSKPEVKSGGEDTSELASITQAGEQSRQCGASGQLPTASGQQKMAVIKPTLASVKQPRAKKSRNTELAIEESFRRLTTDECLEKEETSTSVASLPRKVSIVFGYNCMKT